jgi:hypothetical protein
MNHPKITSLILALGLACSGASAQVAPPPPAEEEKAPTAQPQPQQQTRPAARPAERPQPAGGAQRLPTLPTNIPYPKLAQKGDDGTIIRLKDLPDVVALRANPTVGPKSVDAIMPVIYGRRARFEMLVIDNLDLMWNLRDGAIHSTDMNDLQSLATLTETIKPLVGKTTLSEELTNRGILTRVQGGMNEHIVKEYKQAIADEIQLAEGTDGMMEFLRFILEDSIHEASLAYYGLMVELTVNAKEVLEGAGLQSEAVAALTGPVSADSDERDEQVERMDAALRTMKVDDAIKLLSHMRDSRPNPNVSPTVVRVDVMHPNKSDQTESDLKAVIQRNPNQAPARQPAQQPDQEQPASEQPSEEQPTPAALAPVGSLIDTGC